MIPYWYGKPREFYEDSLPRFTKMSHASARFYDFLFWMSDRRSSRRFDAVDEDITQRTTLAKRTLAIARKDLEKRGLIVCNRLPRGYSYTVCDPSTGLPFPGDPKTKIIPIKRKSSPTTPAEQPEEEEPKEPELEAPAIPQPPVITPPPTPQPIPQHTLHTLPLRPDGERDYGFDELFEQF